ncbi:MAG: hypothetical protein GY711_19985 [bacterium]|nr:hypothetical protein [bacterium]
MFSLIRAVSRPRAWTPRLLLLVLLASAACTSTKQTVGFGALDELGPPRARVPRPAHVDVEHYGLDLALHPDERRIEGSCLVRFRVLDRELASLRLDLRGLEVEEVRGAGGESLTFEHFNGQLDIALEPALVRGDTSEVVVRYGGEPRKGLSFAGGRSVPTHAFTQGECEDSHWWFPCWDSPADRATSELRVTMPANWTSVAAGERLSSVTLGASKVEHWRMVTPHPTYLTTLVAGDLTTFESEWEGVPLSYHAPDRFADRLESSLAATPDALAFLSEITGKRYPYAKYSTACVENFPFGGMENVSATTLTVDCLGDETAQRDGDATGLVVHEAAHQWFGDLLTCERWPEIWLNEGFATYMTAMYVESRDGADAFRVRMRELRERYIENDRGKDRRPIVHDVYRDPIDLFFSGHAYQGGATRLHLLRSTVGDAAFRRGIRRYVGDNQGRAVVTADLRSAMEQASGMDLERFFEQWVHSPGFPEFEVRWRWDEDRQRVLLTVNQTQEVDGGTPEVFEVGVDVEIRTGGANGAKIHRVEISERRHLFELPCPSEPRWVRFDKFGWVPCSVDADKTVREWMALGQGDDDIGGRIDALRVLGEMGESESDEATRAGIRHSLLGRLEGDTSPAVRREAARVLAGVGGFNLQGIDGFEARSGLAFAARSDPDPKVRVAALAALERWGTDENLAELAREVFGSGFSYATTGAAAGLLVKSDPPGAFDWLMGQTIQDNENGDYLRALLPQLARINDPRVVDELRRIGLDRSAVDLVRAEAVRQLGKFGADDAQVRSELIGLLESRLGRVRLEAVKALAALSAEDARSALVDFYTASVYPRERRAIEAAFGR